MIEIDNLGFIHMWMTGVAWINMKNDLLMGVSLDAMLMLFTIVVVLRIQMCMRRRPLEHHKGGKQKNDKCGFGAPLDHEGIELNVVSGLTTPAARTSEYGESRQLARRLLAASSADSCFGRLRCRLKRGHSCHQYFIHSILVHIHDFKAIACGLEMICHRRDTA